MSNFVRIFTPLLLLVKLGLMLGGRMYIVEQQLLFCNESQEVIYFTEDIGLYFMAGFCFQLLLGAE